MQSTQLNKLRQLSYPWFGSLTVLVVALACSLVGKTEFIAHAANTSHVFESFNPDLLLALALCCWLLEWRIFHGRRHRLNQSIVATLAQLELANKTNRQLQQKAQRHSNQTEKLKVFIGDKLLEYIEYDEKYLHFKGIAAEIRHNGIISYDIILRALQNGQRHAPDNSDFKEALTSLGYLWDLLDLSTAENMALHINNQIGECEEYYYQQQLQPKSQAPIEPTFSAHHAIQRALLPYLQDGELSNDDSLALNQIEDSQFQCSLNQQCVLLGNENHLVLAVENLVKNARYYHTQKPEASEDHLQKIMISLYHDTQIMTLTIYNRGPHIPEQQSQKIYQLGFTTRRTGQIHGKGLGLYFVKQIVAGYEGHICHHNIVNQAENYSLRFELQGEGFEGSEIQTALVDVLVNGGSLHCVNKTLATNDEDAEQPLDKLRWNFGRRLRSIEITALSNGKTHTLVVEQTNLSGALLEPCRRHPPRWLLRFNNGHPQCKVEFTPLDVAGVEFVVKLPLANSTQTTLESLEPTDDYLNNQFENHFKPHVASDVPGR